MGGVGLGLEGAEDCWPCHERVVPEMVMLADPHPILRDINLRPLLINHKALKREYLLLIRQQDRQQLAAAGPLSFRRQHRPQQEPKRPRIPPGIGLPQERAHPLKIDAHLPDIQLLTVPHRHQLKHAHPNRIALRNAVVDDCGQPLVLQGGHLLGGEEGRDPVEGVLVGGGGAWEGV